MWEKQNEHIQKKIIYTYTCWFNGADSCGLVVLFIFHELSDIIDTDDNAKTYF